MAHRVGMSRLVGEDLALASRRHNPVALCPRSASDCAYFIVCGVGCPHLTLWGAELFVVSGD